MTTIAPSRWHGVNLGNWLILEKWIKPSLFAGTPAGDEYTFSQHHGSTAANVMRAHRDTYITEADFQWLAEWGVNAVRIPYGYWIVQPDGPYVGGLEVMDRAIDWCAKYGIQAILDLHGAPGCQSGEHHTGRAGFARWHLEPEYRGRTLEVIEAVAQRYGDHPGIGGISLLNEPDNAIPAGMLLEYYQAGYELVRKHMPERVAVVAEAHQNPRLAQFHGQLRGRNIVTDTHYYHCFFPEHLRLHPHEHIAWPLNRLVDRIGDFNHAGDMIVGEWSLATRTEESQRPAPLDPLQQHNAIRAFAATQLYTYELTRGWFFWTYKTEDRPLWSFRDSVGLGYLPAKLQG